MVQAIVVGVGIVVHDAAVVAALGALAVPFLVDLALLATVPVERRLAAPYVARASARLAAVRPTVVAMTGSYGKTSTKGHIAHLVGGTLTVVPTPATSTTAPGWPGPSTSTWWRARTCSWPRWAPTGRARSPTCAAGSRRTSP